MKNIYKIANKFKNLIKNKKNLILKMKLIYSKLILIKIKKN